MLTGISNKNNHIISVSLLRYLYQLDDRNPKHWTDYVFLDMVYMELYKHKYNFPYTGYFSKRFLNMFSKSNNNE